MKNIFHKEINTLTLTMTGDTKTIEARSQTLHLEQTFFDQGIDLLIRAFNNRTRQYNFFKLYSDLLDGSISEDEYDRELDENEDKYVIPEPKETSPSDIEIAYYLSERMDGVDSTEDFTSLFSISDNSLSKLLGA